MKSYIDITPELIAYDEEVELELIEKDPDIKTFAVITYIIERARNWADHDFDYRSGEYIDHFVSLSPDEIRGFCKKYAYYEEWAKLTLAYLEFNKLMRVKKQYYKDTACKILAIFEYYYHYVVPGDDLKQMADSSINDKSQNLKKEFDDICDEQDKLYRPEFETVFSILFEVDEKQKLIYNTNLWDMSYKLPDKPDLIPINVALSKSAYTDDDAFCADFIRYCTITLRGKKIMQQQARSSVINLNKQTIQVKGWVFKSIAICAPEEIQRLCIDKLYENAVVTQTRNKDLGEYLDSVANANDFKMNCNLVPYIDKLEQFNVINGENSFLNNDKTLVLFKSLNVVLDIIKNNSNKPYKVKYEISEFLKKFDTIKVWGVFIQILILEGLVDLFLRLKIDEPDPGYNEAQSIYDYIASELQEKEIIFCLMPYGPKDLQRLEPFCDFLMHTEMGKHIQEGLSKDIDTLNKWSNSMNENRYFKAIRESQTVSNWENNTDGRFLDIDGVGVYRFIPSTIGDWWNLNDISYIKKWYYDSIKVLPVIATGLIPQYIRWEQEKDVKKIFEDYYNNCFATFKNRARGNIKLMMKSESEIEAAYIETLNKEEKIRIKLSLEGLSPYIPDPEQTTLIDVGDCFIDMLNDKLKTLQPSVDNAHNITIENVLNTHIQLKQHKQQLSLPNKLNTENAQKYFTRAIENNYLELTDGGAIWKTSQIQLGYFCYKIYKKPRPIAAIQSFFNKRNVGASITQADVTANSENPRNDVQEWLDKMNKTIFFD